MNDSLIGYISATINNSLLGDSAIGFMSGTISDPGTYSNSSIGYVTGSLYPPHNPIGTWDGNSIIWVPIKTWDGSNLI